MGLNLEDILAKLDEEKTAEEDFEESLTDSESKVDSEKVEKEAADEADSDEEQEEKEAADTSTESDQEDTEETEVKEASEESSEDEEESYEKLASDLEQQGRIMAQGFVDELNKLASGQEAEDVEASEDTKTKTAAEETENSFVDQAAESLMTRFIN